MEFPYSRKTFRCCNSHSANTHFATEFVSSKINVIPYPSTLNYKLSVRTYTAVTNWTSAKFWHQHLVLQAYLAIGKHIKVSDWFLTKTDVGIRTDKGRRRILKPIYQSTNCSEKFVWSSFPPVPEKCFCGTLVSGKEGIQKRIPPHLCIHSELLTRELRA